MGRGATRVTRIHRRTSERRMADAVVGAGCRMRTTSRSASPSSRTRSRRSAVTWRPLGRRGPLATDRTSFPDSVGASSCAVIVVSTTVLVPATPRPLRLRHRARHSTGTLGGGAAGRAPATFGDPAGPGVAGCRWRVRGARRRARRGGRRPLGRGGALRGVRDPSGSCLPASCGRFARSITDTARP